MTTATKPSPSVTTYDEVPYTSHPFAQTHPDRLATVATLMGLRPAPVTSCRVLELGCASGGNLLPMAIDLPDSRFLGVDLSSRQVEDGRRIIETLGLRNIELRAIDIMAIGPDLGQFDYIICHGVYSWVPAPVRDKILSICRHNLAPNGVAYVSYNTYPGWHMRGMIRDMMAYHARRFQDNKRKVSQARALLDFLAESAGGAQGPYALLLKQELEILRDKPDDYLLHEHLEDVNDPFYFHEFIHAARAHRLAYLGEAQVGTMAAHNFPPKVREAMQRVANDQVQREQYMDFIRNRQFRQTLLCHDSLTVDHAVGGSRLAGMHIASRATPVATPDLTSDQADRFDGPDKTSLTTREVMLKAALLELAPVFPGRLPFEELYERAALRVLAAGGKPEGDMVRLGANLLNCYVGGLVEVWPRRHRFVVQVSEHPVACPLVRLQAAQGSAVTNRRHERIRLNEVEQQVLARLDGSRDHATLARELAGLCLTGVLNARQDGELLRDPHRIEQSVSNALPSLLARVARMALLIG